MKLDRRFHCFGCNSDGDVIDFAARLFNLSPKEAAMKLADDFGIIYDKNKVPATRPILNSFPDRTFPTFSFAVTNSYRFSAIFANIHPNETADFNGFLRFFIGKRIIQKCWKTQYLWAFEGI